MELQRTQSRRNAQRGSALLLLLLLATACRTAAPPGAPPPPVPEPPPALPVKKAPGELLVSAHAEPSKLRPGGGQAQIIVRVRKPGGAPAVGVPVRLSAAGGTLYSRGRLLKTNASGMTRDRVTARQTAIITVNAGGTHYRLTVPVLESGGG